MPGETILVIDDSPTIQKVVQLVLTKADYRVVAAHDGEEGLQQALASKPDLILLDFVMPRMNGYQFCRELANEPRLKDIPVVLMSAKGDQVGERFVSVMGIVDYITKPFSPDAITGMVQRTLAKFTRPEGSLDAPLPEEDTNGPSVSPEEAERAAQQQRHDALRSARRRIADALRAVLHEDNPDTRAAGEDTDAPAPADAASADQASAEEAEATADPQSDSADPPRDGAAADNAADDDDEVYDDDEDEPTRSRPSVALIAEVDEITAVGGVPAPDGARPTSESDIITSATPERPATAPITAKARGGAQLTEDADTGAIERIDLDTVEFSGDDGELAPAAPDTSTATDGQLDVHSLVERALGDPLLGDIVRTAAAALRAAEPPPSLSGDIRLVPLAQVLRLFGEQMQTGVLRVEHQGYAVSICYRKGRIELALATGFPDDFLFGRFVVGLGAMSAEDLDGFLANRAPGKKLIGTQLVMLGYITEEARQHALARQTSEFVFAALRWRAGSFEFVRTTDLPMRATDAALGLDVEAVLMEGLRQADEWHLIEREVDDMDLVFLRNDEALAQLGRNRLTREEQIILDLVNGKNTVKDIVRKSRRGSFDVAQMLVRLSTVNLVRRRVAPVVV